MKATRFGFYHNMTHTQIPFGDSVIKPGEKVHSSDPRFALITQRFETFLTPEASVPNTIRQSHKEVTAINKPGHNVVIEPIIEPVIEPIIEPVIEPIIEPVIEPIIEPVIEPIIEPVIEPIIEPVIEPVVEPEKPKKAKSSKK